MARYEKEREERKKCTWEKTWCLPNSECNWFNCDHCSEGSTSTSAAAAGEAVHCRPNWPSAAGTNSSKKKKKTTLSAIFLAIQLSNFNVWIEKYQQMRAMCNVLIIRRIFRPERIWERNRLCTATQNNPNSCSFDNKVDGDFQRKNEENLIFEICF